MVTFGKRLREAREEKGLSQQELAKAIGSVHTVIGRYERDEMKPSIDVVKKLGTIVGYLIGKAKEVQQLKDPATLWRFQQIDEMDDKAKECVFSLLDAFIAKSKLKTLL
jgi:ribosome-binding protein aMBF1 (putative translation factor)